MYSLVIVYFGDKQGGGGAPQIIYAAVLYWSHPIGAIYISLCSEWVKFTVLN